MERNIGPVTIRAASAEDAASITRIYNHYISETIVTFEEEPIAPSDMAQRMAEVHSASLPWLVAESSDQVFGYAYASKWKGRCAYRFSAEITVYLDHTRLGLGLGSRLYAELFSLLKVRGIHAAIGGIALPNAASVALHEKFGLKKAAHFPEVGFKFERWHDVGYWHRTLA